MKYNVLIIVFMTITMNVFAQSNSKTQKASAANPAPLTPKSIDKMAIKETYCFVSEETFLKYEKRILAKDKNLAKTFLASKEYEKRAKLIQSMQGDIAYYHYPKGDFEHLYLQNLDKNIWEVDSVYYLCWLDVEKALKQKSPKYSFGDVNCKSSKKISDYFYEFWKEYKGKSRTHLSAAELKILKENIKLTQNEIKEEEKEAIKKEQIEWEKRNEKMRQQWAVEDSIYQIKAKEEKIRTDFFNDSIGKVYARVEELQTYPYQIPPVFQSDTNRFFVRGAWNFTCRKEEAKKRTQSHQTVLKNTYAGAPMVDFNPTIQIQEDFAAIRQVWIYFKEVNAYISLYKVTYSDSNTYYVGGKRVLNPYAGSPENKQAFVQEHKIMFWDMGGDIPEEAIALPEGMTAYVVALGLDKNKNELIVYQPIVIKNCDRNTLYQVQPQIQKHRALPALLKK